ncbi:MAG: helix-turn-helix domain-containing protein [Candidatus Izemoplasmatales bacterium]
MELYKKLQYIRKIRGMTQQDIADSFNISRQAIQKWENGESAPDISKLYDLSIIYNISLDILLDDSLTENQLTSLVLSKNLSCLYGLYHCF